MKKIYEERVVYQIYPASFSDANNDGFGDLKGITSKLDYLKDLGVGIIWLSPIYASPLADMGYDISDYKAINPKFGTMEDFDCLMHEANIHDIKIVMDLVLNHTSSEHYWFKEAINNPTTKYRNYYYFAKGKGRKNNKAPNNWQSVFVGSAWEPLANDKTTYCMHLFCKEQIDLNYHDENLIKDVEDIMRFWLEKGVYGFRCDTISNAWKTSLANGKPHITQTGKEYYENQEGNHKLLQRFQKDVLSKYGAFMVGEIQGCTVDIANTYIKNKELNMCITFEHQNVDRLAAIPVIKKIYRPINLINAMFKYQEGCISNCLYLENHDQLRSVSRFVKPEYSQVGAKAYALFLLTLRGTPFIYQGEEIGMTNMSNNIKTIDESRDVVVHNLYNTLRKFFVPKKLALKLTKLVNRDNERTPMQWNDRVNAGFNAGWAPWLKVNSNYLDKKINVADETNDSDSVLNFYKSLIKYRNDSDVLKYGSFKRLPSNKNVAKYIREYEGHRLLIIVNLSNHKIIDKENCDRSVILSNYRQDFLKIIPPYFAALYLIP